VNSADRICRLARIARSDHGALSTSQVRTRLIALIKGEIGEIRRNMATKLWVILQTFVLLSRHSRANPIAALRVARVRDRSAL
jgi:hypothetical protein